MYAIIRESTVRPDAQEQYPAARAEFAALRAQQPGNRGSVGVDLGGGRLLTIALWESEQAQAAATPILQAHAARLLYPHLTAPPQIVYQGSVIADDLTSR